MKRPILISIAGFDPSGGAGVLADVKTFEAHKCYGMSVLTANTVQTEDQFESVEWINSEAVLNQLELLLNSHEVTGVKIGLIESFELVSKIASRIKEKSNGIIVIWDPILTASAGFEFHDEVDFNSTLEHIDWITPNQIELDKLLKWAPGLDGLGGLTSNTQVYLTGGHGEVVGRDILYSKESKLEFRSRGEFAQKHGSGCVLSSTFLANLAKGKTIKKAGLLTKDYVTRFFKSEKGLLGYHKL